MVAAPYKWLGYIHTNPFFACGVATVGTKNVLVVVRTYRTYRTYLIIFFCRHDLRWNRVHLLVDLLIIVIVLRAFQAVA